MAQNQIRHPHFLFSVDSIEQSPEYHPRIERRAWQPPRPQGSNVRVPSHTAGKVYEYYAGTVRQMNAASGKWEQFRTYSFYFCNGKIQIYPADAITCQVGDGTGNAPRTRAVQQSMQAGGDRHQYRGGDQPLYDWRPLSFNVPANANGSRTTQACFRGNQQTFGVMRNEPSHMNALLQLLPNACFASFERIPPSQSSGALLCGGLVGQIPVLIALVAFSVRPENVEQALLGCFRNPYIAHEHPRTTGWIEGRGLLVRVWCEAAPQTAGRQSPSRSFNPSRDVLCEFENGRLPGYNKFVD